MTAARVGPPAPTSGGDVASDSGDGADATAAFRLLRGLVREREPVERCELCGTPLPERHEHLLEVDPARRLLCACVACALLFEPEEAVRYRRVPKRIWLLAGFDMTDAEWEALAIPVGMAFLQTTGAGAGVRAHYPSPAGPTESLLTLEGWGELVERNPRLRSLEPDVEALLVNRVGESHEHYLVPVDVCYELVGLIRLHWRGLSGGDVVHERIAAFFADLRARATVRDGAGA